ncbi:MAG: amidohydrolase [Candidatus Zixiibacteriota bacterium]|nr:MAG: amidohydrolase [candidate division Zixibacteria bacterium]
MLSSTLLRCLLILVLGQGFFPAGALTEETPAQPADLVLHGGKIVTMDEQQPQAAALAVSDGVIIDVGSDEEIRPYMGRETTVINLEGKLAVPGFIEGHAHFMSLGNSLMMLNLNNCRSWSEVVALVEQEVGRRNNGEWIIGRGWHQDKWQAVPEPDVDGLPYHHDLSLISPDNPVLLSHASGHSCIANAGAMRLANITSQTVDPEGGRIVRDGDGEPIGVFLETAMDSLYAARDRALANRTAEETEKTRRRVVELATRECLAKGVTGFQDAGSSFETIDLLRQMAEDGELGIRLWVMISEENDSLRHRIDEYKIIRAGNGYLTVRAIKRLIDGALGSHGAWLLEPYSDLPASTGLNTETIQVLAETARIAAEHGFQMCTHAIGDRGNREILNVYESALKAHPAEADRRWRVEHAQHLHPDDIPRFGQLGVIASMQGIHCTSDGPWVPKRIGDERAAEGAYVWRKLIESGAIISNGTDAPVEDVDPIANFYALVTRRLADGTAFNPEQRMTRKEALRLYTINAAYAAFEEDIKGSLTPGKLADITILSKDIMTIPDDEILDAEIVNTIVAGKVMYQK